MKVRKSLRSLKTSPDPKLCAAAARSTSSTRPPRGSRPVKADPGGSCGRNGSHRGHLPDKSFPERRDISLVRGEVLAAVDAIRLSRRTFTTIRGNLCWAFGYNLLATAAA
jgi:hypothetical protein